MKISRSRGRRDGCNHDVLGSAQFIFHYIRMTGAVTQ
jgi:hypothetical protein